MHRNISITICEACKKEGIDYHSIHLLEADLERIQKMCWDLRTMEDEIATICERYKVNGNKKILQDDIENLDKIVHDLRDVAQKIKKND